MTVNETLPKNKKVKYDKSNNDKGRRITDKDYASNLRHTPVLIGLNTTKKVLEGFNRMYKQLNFIIITE